MKTFIQKITLLVVGLILTTNMASASFTAHKEKNEYSPFSFELSAGSVASDTIIVENLGDEDAILNIYGADAKQSSTGSFALSTQNDEQTTAGKWISFKDSQINVRPHEKKTILFTVTVPENTPPGSYAGGIAVETIALKNEGSSGPTLSVISRFATPVYIQIPGAKKYDAQWSDFSYHVDANNINRFDFSFKNEGNTSIVAESKLEIFGYPDGNSVEIPAVSDEETKAALLLKRNENIVKLSDISLNQNDSITVSSFWKKKPLFGNYTARGTVTLYEYDIKSGKKINPETITKEINFTIIDWKIVVAILSLLAIIIGTTLYKTLKMHSLKKISKNYVVKEDDTLENISKKAGVNWKLVAKLNKLKPPYTLQKGQNISLPSKKK